jgi:hypothetical protein
MARILIVKKSTYEVYLDAGGKPKMLVVAESRAQARKYAQEYENELGLPKARKAYEAELGLPKARKSKKK